MTAPREPGELLERIKSRCVRNERGCLVWTGAKTYDRHHPLGYGQIWLNGANARVHRLMWSLVNGPIPEGFIVMHTCDNPPCCEPTHLVIGSHADNTADKVRKGRQARVRVCSERNGKAKLSDAEVAAIRRMRRDGTPARSLAATFGVTEGHIYDIINYTLRRGAV
jgi:hypothetical protein